MFMTELSIVDLVEAKEAAAKVTKQFPLRPAKVKQIIRSIQKHNQFLSAFTLATFNDEWFLVGGRHRLQALQTIINESEDHTVLEATDTDQVFPCLVHEVETLADVVLLTQFDNDSRAMPPAEKQYLGFSFDVQLDGEDYSVNNVSRLRTAYLYLEISHPTLPTNTIRQIWGATIGSLDKAQKKVLTTNEVALRAFGREFERLLVDAAKSTTTPARNYKKVAEKIVLANVADALTGFEMVHKQRLTKRDKEDVAILGAALERSLNRGDDLYEARMGRIDKAIEAEKKSPVFATVDDDEDTPF